MFKNIRFLFAIFAITFYAVPVMAQDACEGQVGAAFGLCNAYCEAMDCDSGDPQASENACNKVYDRFFTQTGSPPPCEISCPCFTLEELDLGGPIAECGENFPGFDNLAGANYVSGDIACSGENCATLDDTLSCAYSVTNVVLSPISPEDNDSCGALILANCDNPNQPQTTATAADSASAAFIDQ